MDIKISLVELLKTKTNSGDTVTVNANQLKAYASERNDLETRCDNLIAELQLVEAIYESKMLEIYLLKANLKMMIDNKKDEAKQMYVDLGVRFDERG